MDSRLSPPRSAYFVYRVESSIGSSLNVRRDFVLNSRNHCGSFRMLEIVCTCCSNAVEVTNSDIGLRATVRLCWWIGKRLVLADGASHFELNQSVELYRIFHGEFFREWFHEAHDYHA